MYEFEGVMFVPYSVVDRVLCFALVFGDAEEFMDLELNLVQLLDVSCGLRQQAGKLVELLGV